MNQIKFNEKTCTTICTGQFASLNLWYISTYEKAAVINRDSLRTPTISNINTLATKMNQIIFNKRTCLIVQFSLLDLHTHKKNTLVTPTFWTLYSFWISDWTTFSVTSNRNVPESIHFWIMDEFYSELQQQKSDQKYTQCFWKLGRNLSVWPMKSAS